MGESRLVKCDVCKIELEEKDLLEYKLSITTEKEGKSEDYMDPISLDICKNCGNDETTIIKEFYKLYERKVLKMPDYVYVIWYEDENKGIVKNEDGDWWFNYRDAVKTARAVAKIENEPVLIQKGTKIWKFLPDGKEEEISI